MGAFNNRWQSRTRMSWPFSELLHHFSATRSPPCVSATPSRYFSIQGCSGSDMGVRVQVCLSAK